MTHIISLTGTVHPQARIDSVSPESGTVVFAWLDADGNAVDSGGSVARFTPLAPLPAEEGSPVSYPEVSDEVLADAIANPPLVPAPVPSVVSRRQLFLWLNAAPRNITRAMLRASLAGNEAALIELEEAVEFQRSHPLVASLAASLGIDADTAFREAATL